MPSPTTSTSSLRPELATFMELDLEMEQRKLIGMSIMPSREVSKGAGIFSKIKLKSLIANANFDARRTSTGGYNSDDYEWEEDSFKTKERGLKSKIDDREEALYEDFFSLEEIAKNRAWERLLTVFERDIIDLAVTQVNGAGQTNAVASGVWTDHNACTPIDDVEQGADAIWQRTGLWPNTLVLSRRRFRDARRLVQVLNEIKSQGAGTSGVQRRVTEAMLAEVFDVDRVVVANKVHNTANRAKNPQVASLFPDDQALLVVAAQTEDMAEPCFGRTLHWGGDGSMMPGSDQRLVGVVETYRNEEERADYCRVRMEREHKVLYQEAAQVVTGLA